MVVSSSGVQRSQGESRFKSRKQQELSDVKKTKKQSTAHKRSSSSTGVC